MVTLAIVLFIVIIGLSLYDEGVQPGLLAIAAGFFLAIAIGEWSYAETVAKYPSSLFLTLSGILLFFSAAVTNGTIDNIVHSIFQRLPSRPALVPFAMGGIVVLLTSLGVGNIGATAILAPAVMAAARMIGLKPFLMILLIVGAANAGALSPLAFTGVLTRELIATHQHDYSGLDLSSFSTRLFAITFGVQTVISIGGFFLLGGMRWIRNVNSLTIEKRAITWTRDQKITLICITLFVLIVLLCSFPAFEIMGSIRNWGSQVAAVSFLMLSALLILRATDIKKTINTVPWASVLMITGIVMYIEIAASAGAIDSLTDIIIRIAPDSLLTPLLFAFSGLLSVFSSSSGVIMPLFISLAPGLASSTVTAGEIITGVAIGAHLVDTSPLSSLGALCIATAQTHEKQPGLYRSLLVWAFFMVLVGTLLSWLLASL